MGWMMGGESRPKPINPRTPTPIRDTKTHHREEVGLGVVDGGARGRLLDRGHGERLRELQGRVHGRGGAVDGEGLCRRKGEGGC